MRPGPALLNELVTQLRWEREIGEPVTVQVPELYLAQPEFDAAEAVRMTGHADPAQHFFLDGPERALHVCPNSQGRAAISLGLR